MGECFGFLDLALDDKFILELFNFLSLQILLPRTDLLSAFLARFLH